MLMQYGRKQEAAICGTHSILYAIEETVVSAVYCAGGQECDGQNLQKNVHSTHAITDVMYAHRVSCVLLSKGCTMHTRSTPPTWQTGTRRVRVRHSPRQPHALHNGNRLPFWTRATLNRLCHTVQYVVALHFSPWVLTTDDNGDANECS
jgi:hypothetical protein